MGNTLFGTDIAGIVAKEIGPGVLPAVLIKVVAGTRNPANPSAGTQPTETRYTCRGFIDSQKNDTRPTTITSQQNKVIVLIGDTIEQGQIPESTDKIEIEGLEYTIIGEIDRDPAAATYTCPVKANIG